MPRDDGQVQTNRPSPPPCPRRRRREQGQSHPRSRLRLQRQMPEATLARALKSDFLGPRPAGCRIQQAPTFRQIFTKNSTNKHYLCKAPPPDHMPRLCRLLAVLSFRNYSSVAHNCGFRLNATPFDTMIPSRLTPWLNGGIALLASRKRRKPPPQRI